LASVDLFRSSMGGVLGLDSILDPIPRVGGMTIKGKCGVVILEDRDDDNIEKHCWAMPRCLQTHVATNASNVSFPSMHAGHKRGHKRICHLPKIFNYFLII
jgi:hypothetical protein